MRVTITVPFSADTGFWPYEVPDGFGDTFSEPDPNDTDSWPFPDAPAIYAASREAWTEKFADVLTPALTAALREDGLTVDSVRIAVVTDGPDRTTATVHLESHDDQAHLAAQHATSEATGVDRWAPGEQPPAHWTESAIAEDYAWLTDLTLAGSFVGDPSDAAQAADDHANHITLLLRAGVTLKEWAAYPEEDRPTTEALKTLAALRTRLTHP